MEAELGSSADDREQVQPDEEEEEEMPRSKAYFRRVSMNIYWRTLVFFIITTVYILIGGAMFSAIERPNELSQNQAMIDANDSYYSVLFGIVDLLVNNTNLTTDQAIVLLSEIGDSAVDLSSISVTDNWLYGPAVFFASTVVTTIGYGSIAPVTTLGRFFFIPYALVGIPITLIFLSELGALLNRAYNRVTRPLGKRMEQLWVRLLVLLVGSIIGLVAFIFIPAIIFSAIDGWTYFEAIYFSFVSLTTVGFGDFVPSAPSRSVGLYRVCLAVWIFFGLAFVALIIAQVQEQMTKIGESLKKCKKLHKMKKLKITENEKEISLPDEVNS